MARFASVGIGALVLVAVGAYADQRRIAASQSTAISIAAPAQVALSPAPIRPDWVREGNPDTRAGEIARSNDGMTQVYVWQTTKSRFVWNYEFDETITVVDGEVFISDDGGPERRLGPGDSAFFPTGAHTAWRVPDHVRKIATVKKPLPGLAAGTLRWMRIVKTWMSPSASEPAATL